VAQERYAFVIRLWNEPGQAVDPSRQPGEVRGSIHSTHSEQIFYFDSFDKIPELLKEITGWQSDEGEAQDGAA